MYIILKRKWLKWILGLNKKFRNIDLRKIINFWKRVLNLKEIIKRWFRNYLKVKKRKRKLKIKIR